MAQDIAQRLFPLGIATGPAFCNRDAERETLRQNLQTGRHTWLMAPRRYGKTSLLHQALLDLQRPGQPPIAGVTVDLLVTYDVASVQSVLLEGVGRLSSELLPLYRQALKKLRTFFTSLKPEIVLSEAGAQVRFTPGQDHPQHITAALEGLDRLAADRGIQAVMVMDEFQQLGTLPQHERLEAAVRHAMERAKHVTYVFAGSRRHLLARMFEDAARPLYHLCDRLAVARIEAGHYRPFLQQAAHARWQQPLSDGTLEAILTATGRHPYYMNLLCGRLWRQRRTPRPKDVRATWARYVQEEQPRVAAELSRLSPNQRAVLAAVAEAPTDQPRSKAFLERTRLASASVGQAVQVLVERDLLWRDEDGVLQLLDPAMASYLNQPRLGLPG